MSIEYVKNWNFWVDRGYDYYLASRVCFLADITRPTYFCMYQMIENLLKAVIIRNDMEEDVKKYKHDLKKLYERCNKITKGIEDVFTERFWERYKSFQQDTRYPSRTNYLHSEQLLGSIDEIFYDIFVIFNCNLKEAKRLIVDVETGNKALVDKNECLKRLKNRFNL
jgi:HEPN domain-containing protein